MKIRPITRTAKNIEISKKVGVTIQKNCFIVIFDIIILFYVILSSEHDSWIKNCLHRQDFEKSLGKRKKKNFYMFNKLILMTRILIGMVLLLTII